MPAGELTRFRNEQQRRPVCRSMKCRVRACCRLATPHPRCKGPCFKGCRPWTQHKCSQGAWGRMRVSGHSPALPAAEQAWKCLSMFSLEKRQTFRTLELDTQSWGSGLCPVNENPCKGGKSAAADWLTGPAGMQRGGNVAGPEPDDSCSQASWSALKVNPCPRLSDLTSHEE